MDVSIRCSNTEYINGEYKTSAWTLDEIMYQSLYSITAYIPKTPEYAHLFPSSFALRRERTDFELLAEELIASKNKAKLEMGEDA